MDGFEDIQRLREDYEAVLDEAETHRAAYHQAIRKAYLAGASLAEIAEELGLSRQRVHEIVGKEPAARRRKRKQVLGSAGILGLVALAGFGSWLLISYERSSPPVVPRPDPCHPCPGWRYEAAYRPASGEIIAVLARKGTVMDGAFAVAKNRHGEDASSLMHAVMNAERSGDPSILPKGVAFGDVTADPRIRELLRGDLDDYYMNSGRIQRSRRELALGIAWGIIGTIGLIGLIVWNVRSRRSHIRPIATAS